MNKYINRWLLHLHQIQCWSLLSWILTLQNIFPQFLLRFNRKSIKWWLRMIFTPYCYSFITNLIIHQWPWWYFLFGIWIGIFFRTFFPSLQFLDHLISQRVSNIFQVWFHLSDMIIMAILSLNMILVFSVFFYWFVSLIIIDWILIVSSTKILKNNPTINLIYWRNERRKFFAQTVN